MVSAERDRHSVMETPSLERYQVFLEIGMAVVCWGKYLPADTKNCISINSFVKEKEILKINKSKE